MAQSKLNLIPIEEEKPKLDLVPLDLEPIEEIVEPQQETVITQAARPESPAPSQQGFLSTIGKLLSTLYGEEDSALPAIRGVTRPALPELELSDANSHPSARVGDFVYNNLIRPSTSAIGAATDFAGGKVINAGVKGYRALRGISKIASKADNVLPEVANAIDLKPNILPDKPNIIAEPVIAPKVSEPTKGSVVWLKKPTIENLKKAREAGYEFEKGGIRDDGAFKLVYTGNKKSPILEETVKETRPTKSNVERIGNLADLQKTSKVAEALNLTRGLMASFDFSAPLRQGIGLVHKKQWWQSWDDMFKSFGSENAFRAVQQEIADKPLFRPRVGPDNKQLPSFAHDAGLKLTDLTDLSNREEAIMSTWAEKIPGIGRGVRMSNRAYTGFLNKLRADTFEDLIQKGKVFGADGEANLPLAREIAEFVNTATGRGNLGKLESSAVALNSTFFSPRLIASRLKMLDPRYYINSDPMVRKEALKSLFAIASAGTLVSQLGKMAGAKVESDPTSSDFGKPRFGNVRLDPYGGFQQYIVLANRLAQGRTKSSTTGNSYSLDGSQFGRPTRMDTAYRFGESKLHPAWSFVNGFLKGKDYTGQPFNLSEEAVSRFVPIFLQDLKSLSNENPELLGDYDLKDLDDLIFALPAMFGMSSQKYGKE
jgi:hypothetical protein